jgi:hypothetical protein
LDDQYWKSEAGQFLSQSWRYFQAARILLYSKQWRLELQSPTLSLVAHGIELLCKFPLISSGKSQDEVKREYGHDLQALWQRPENSRLRAATYKNGRVAWHIALSSGKWPIEQFTGNPDQVIDDAVKRLATLHGSESRYALRYTLEKETMAPRPAFLIDAFGGVAERLVSNPEYLNLQ